MQAEGDADGIAEGNLRSDAMRYDFLVQTYETERIKVVSVWSEFRDGDLEFRPNRTNRRGRSVLEQMVHQCVSEDLWFQNMLGMDVGAPPLRREKRGWASCSATPRTAASA